MDFPLAYHITWTTYGTWLPGDEREWIERGTTGIQSFNAAAEDDASKRMFDDPVVLTPHQREIVAKTIDDHCHLRGWFIHVHNVRTNHVHVVVTASCEPEKPLDELKSWASRRLNTEIGEKCRWWTYHGSTKYIWDETYLQNAIRYVRDAQ